MNESREVLILKSLAATTQTIMRLQDERAKCGKPQRKLLDRAIDEQRESLKKVMAEVVVQYGG